MGLALRLPWYDYFAIEPAVAMNIYDIAADRGSFRGGRGCGGGIPGQPNGQGSRESPRTEHPLSKIIVRHVPRFEGSVIKTVRYGLPSATNHPPCSVTT